MAPEQEVVKYLASFMTPVQQEVVDYLTSLSIIDFINLTKTLETRWGIKIEITITPVGPPTEKTTRTVRLTAPGALKISVIKAVREVTGLSLRDAKSLVDAAPSDVLTTDINTAYLLVKKLEAAGAEVEIR
jgi:large subunit ribosomal protein L7/L12